MERQQQAVKHHLNTRRECARARAFLPSNPIQRSSCFVKWSAEEQSSEENFPKQEQSIVCNEALCGRDEPLKPWIKYFWWEEEINNFVVFGFANCVIASPSNFPSIKRSIEFNSIQICLPTDTTVAALRSSKEVVFSFSPLPRRSRATYRRMTYTCDAHMSMNT